MKKFLSILLLLIFSVSAVGCGERLMRPNHSDDASLSGGGQSGGDSQPPSKVKITLSDMMFDSVVVDSDNLSGDSIGIVAEKELINSEVKNSYFVTFKEDGTYEKIVFTKTISEDYSDGTQEIRQEEIEGNAQNLYINEKFIFMSFTAYSPDPSAAGSDFFYSDDFNKVFLVERATGKMYSMNDFSSFTVKDTGIIKSEENYYRLQITDGVLSATDIMPNKKITVYSVSEDKFGNVYAYNNQLDSSNGKVFYVTVPLFKGADGYCYDIRGGLYQSYSFPGEVKISRKNAAGQDEICTSLNTLLCLDADSGHYLCFRGSELYELSENPYNGYLYGRYEYDSFVTYAGFTTLKNARFIGDSIVVGERYDDIYYYDLSSDKTFEGYSGSRNVTFEREGIVMDRGQIHAEGGEVFVQVEEALGTEVYRLVEENGKIVPKLFVRTDYDAEVIIIQPLN